jgi:hypothetical protein
LKKRGTGKGIDPQNVVVDMQYRTPEFTKDKGMGLFRNLELGFGIF